MCLDISFLVFKAWEWFVHVVSSLYNETLGRSRKYKRVTVGAHGEEGKQKQARAGGGWFGIDGQRIFVSGYKAIGSAVAALVGQFGHANL